MTSKKGARDWDMALGAALAGWLVPGLGHWLRGEPRRAALLACALGTLWGGGLLIGGLSVIDHTSSQEWFVRMGQFAMAPSLGVDVLRAFAAERDALRLVESLGPARQQGVLWTGVAGYLNVLVLLDLLMPRAREGEA
jgi:hypothetical protein